VPQRGGPDGSLGPTVTGDDRARLGSPDPAETADRRSPWTPYHCNAVSTTSLSALPPCAALGAGLLTPPKPPSMARRALTFRHPSIDTSSATAFHSCRC